MRRMNCQIARREIEEAPAGEVVGGVVFDHLQSCASCATFSNEQAKLREIIGSLGTIEAPGDFDFKLRARLAGERPRAGSSFHLPAFAFGPRSAAFATLLLVFGAGLLFVSMRSSRDAGQLATVRAPAPAVEKTVEPVARPDTIKNTSEAATTNDRRNAPAATVSNGPKSHPVYTSTIASNRNSNRPKSRDLSTSGAPVLKSSDLNARASDFQIRASRQPLKVSLENVQGGSRTISLPAVSFGSQRVLPQNASLMASARGSW